MILNLSRISCIGEALKDSIAAHKSNMALIEVDRDRENGRWTYREFQIEAERFSALLQEHGIKPGDRVAILMSNQSKWLISATSIFWCGAILVPIDYKLTPAEQLALLKHSRPKALVTEWPMFSKLETDLLTFVSEAPKDVTNHWETKPKAKFQYQGAQPDDVASIVYSSGTGGTPKGCMLTHGNYFAQAEALSRLYPMSEDEIYFSILPTNHAIDFMCGYFMPLLFGATVIHQRTLRPEYISSTMRRYGVTHMALVPMILKALRTRMEESFQTQSSLKKKILDGLIWANSLLTQDRPKPYISKFLLKPIHAELGGRLKYLFAGGAFVDPATAEFFYKIGIPVVIGYGLTEAGTVLTVNDLRPFRSDTVGKPVDGVEIEIRNTNIQGIGEIWARGRTIMKGYFHEPQLTSETVVNGWLKTGDIGVKDASGHLKLLGRSKNMIVTEGGKNIYPEDVEVHFDDIPGVAEQCVFSSTFVWPSGRLSTEKLIIVVKPKSDQLDKAALDQLHERNLRLSDYQRIGGYILWKKDFPRTASMKIKRNHLADELAKELDGPQAIEEIA